jgi:hypothetical protein
VADLAFPLNPALYQTYTANGKTWYWDGKTWIYGSGPGPADPSFASVVGLWNFESRPGDYHFHNDGSAGQLPHQIAPSPLSSLGLGLGNSSLLCVAGLPLQFPSNAAWGFGTGDVTLEAFVYPTSLNGSGNYIISVRASTQSSNFCELNFGATGIPAYSGASAAGNCSITAAGALPLNTLTHVELSRVAAKSYLFVAGVLQNAGGTADLGNYSAAQLTIGGTGFNTGNYEMRGNIKAVRITKGLGRHTVTYTPPTSLFPTH